MRVPLKGLKREIKEETGLEDIKIGSEPGRVIKGVSEAGVRNPIILLYEIDRVAAEAG